MRGMEMKPKFKTLLLFLLVAALSATALLTAVSRGNVSADRAVTERDREGNPITLPQSIERIISLGPSNTEIIVALGFGDNIIASDTYSDNVAGLAAGIPMFNMMSPDGEQLINLQPDVVFVTGMGKAGGDDLLKSVADAGVCIIYVPSSTSLDAIKEDIRYIAGILKSNPAGEALISDMESEIAAIAEIGKTITDKKAVYFEVEAPPYMCSFGDGVFLNEMIEIIGAANIFRNQKSWVSITGESVLSADPDVILTSVNYIEDPIGEIKSRPGWSGMAAVKNGDVHYIDTDSSNRPSHNVVKALREIAAAVYPDIYI